MAAPRDRNRGPRPPEGAGRGRRASVWLGAAWALAVAAAAGAAALVLADPLRGAVMALVLYAYGVALGLPLLCLTWALLARRTPDFRHRPFALVALVWLLPAAAMAGQAVGAHPLAVRLAFSLAPLACCAAALALVLRAGRRARAAAGPPAA